MSERTCLVQQMREPQTLFQLNLLLFSQEKRGSPLPSCYCFLRRGGGGLLPFLRGPLFGAQEENHGPGPLPGFFVSPNSEAQDVTTGAGAEEMPWRGDESRGRGQTKGTGRMVFFVCVCVCVFLRRGTIYGTLLEKASLGFGNPEAPG